MALPSTAIDSMSSALSPTDRTRRRVALALRALVLFVFGVFFVVPLAWLVLAATKTDPSS